jgi:hypothetical protein
MLTNEEIALKILAGEIMLCPRCKGLGQDYRYIGGVNGCALCASGYVLIEHFPFRYWVQYEKAMIEHDKMSREKALTDDSQA